MGFKIVVKLPSTNKFIGFVVDSFELDSDERLVSSVRVLRWKERKYDQTDFTKMNVEVVQKQLNVDFLSVDGLVIYENT